MNIYSAIMKAADQIERYPDSYQFLAIKMPRTAGPANPEDRGCALGWISHFLGAPAGADYDRVLKLNVLPGYDFQDADMAFYHHLDDLTGDPGWQTKAAKVAAALRLYAKAFFSHQAEEAESV